MPVCVRNHILSQIFILVHTMLLCKFAGLDVSCWKVSVFCLIFLHKNRFSFYSKCTYAIIIWLLNSYFLDLLLELQMIILFFGESNGIAVYCGLLYSEYLCSGLPCAFTKNCNCRCLWFIIINFMTINWILCISW